MADTTLDRRPTDASVPHKEQASDESYKRDEAQVCNEDHVALEAQHNLHTPNGKCKSSAHHFKSPSNKKANNGAGYLCHSGHHSHSKQNAGGQNHGNANGIFSHFLKSPLMQKRNKGVLGNSSGDSSSKKMSLFNNSGGLGSASFMDSRNWCGVSPVCNRLREHPAGAPHHLHF